MNVINFEDALCKRVHSQLDSYLNNELTADVMNEAIKHVGSCSTCLSELNERIRLRASLRHAVLSEQAPDNLQGRIRTDLRRTKARNLNLSQYWIVAAAAVVVLAGGLGVFYANRFAGNDGASPLSIAADVAKGDEVGRMLKLGLDDHVFCAIDHGLANQRFTSEEMMRKLHPKFDGLPEAIRVGMPAGYEVVVGHRCHFQTREYVHLILRREREVVSLILTHKRAGEAFPKAGDASSMESQPRVFKASWNGLETAGIETRDHLAFVISPESQKADPEVAASLLRSVSQYLKQLEA